MQGLKLNGRTISCIVVSIEKSKHLQTLQLSLAKLQVALTSLQEHLKMGLLIDEI